MKRGRKKKLAISLMDYMGKRRDMKRQLKKEGTAELRPFCISSSVPDVA